MSGLEGYIKIAAITTLDDVLVASTRLHPRYHRERWQWHLGISVVAIPTSADIFETICHLWLEASPWIATGGLAVVREDGKAELLADPRLAQ